LRGRPASNEIPPIRTTADGLFTSSLDICSSICPFWLSSAGLRRYHSASNAKQTATTSAQAA